ncbi:MAG: VOC family protein [Actinobacteria bacterium]|nr:MAG: VOC family protein [Actinomycetota bacterium]
MPRLSSSVRRVGLGKPGTAADPLPTLASMASSIDHFVVAGPDLEALRVWWAESTGVVPTPGGAHPGFGTRNYLTGIDSSTYVELIGPDPDQPDPAAPRPFGIDDLTGFSLVTFAVAVDDIDEAAARLRACEVDPGEVIAMSRQRPDGESLRWRVAFPPEGGLGGVMPFLIEWGAGTPHPAESLELGVGVESLRLRHPEAAAIGCALREITGEDWEVEEGEPGMWLTLSTRLQPLQLSLS